MRFADIAEPMMPRPIMPTGVRVIRRDGVEIIAYRTRPAHENTKSRSTKPRNHETTKPRNHETTKTKIGFLCASELSSFRAFVVSCFRVLVVTSSGFCYERPGRA